MSTEIITMVITTIIITGIIMIATEYTIFKNQEEPKMDAKEEELLDFIKNHGGLRYCYETYGDKPRTRNNLYYQIITADNCARFATNLSNEFLTAAKATLITSNATVEIKASRVEDCRRYRKNNYR